MKSSKVHMKFGWRSSVGLHIHGEIKFVGLVLSGTAGVLYLLIFAVPYKVVTGSSLAVHLSNE